MKNKLHILVELLAVIPAILYIPLAIYGVAIPIDHISDLWNEPLNEILGLLSIFFLSIGALFGTAGLIWGFVQKIRTKTIERIVMFKWFIFMGLATASISIAFTIYSFPAAAGLITNFLLIAPIYVGVYYLKHFNTSYYKSSRQDAFTRDG